MNMIEKIYFMGIKGVGMASLALIAKQAGFEVTGSDVDEEFITDKTLRKAGINIVTGFSEKNIGNFVSGINTSGVLFITTGAHNGFENPETIFARQSGIRVITHGEGVGLFMSGDLFGREFEGISVAGAHGKTTISSMIAFYLSRLEYDPSYTVGTSEILGLGSAGHYGQGKYFVAEADEYVSEPKHDRVAKFLYQKPKFLIVNNIDFDHPDVYKTLDDVKDAYEKLLSDLPESATLIINGDDLNTKDILGRIRTNYKVIRFGAGSENDFRIKDFKQVGLKSYFEIARGETGLGTFSLSIPGYHNAKNVMAAIAFLIEIGVSVQNIQKILPEFAGSARRFEKVGERDGALIFDDYAHHPEEIKKTIEAAKEAFPERKLTVIFQAHTFSRTRALLSEFASSFSKANEVIIIPTFASMRDKGAESLSEDMSFVERVRMIQPNILYISDPSDVVKYVEQNVKGPYGMVLTLGAGDVYKIAYKIAGTDAAVSIV